MGASLGPLPFSLSLDLTGDYSAALIGAAIVSVLVAIAAAVFLRHPRRPGPEPEIEGKPA